MRKFLAVLLLPFLVACSGSYSFTGADVGNAKTVSIDFFPNYADLVNPQLSQVFTENLRDIFVQQTPLNLVQTNGDLQYEGSIVSYKITPVNAQAGGANDLGSTVSQSRLSIVVNVVYTNTLDESKSFDQQFSRFADFDANNELSAVEDELIEQITTELSENILNQSLGNW